MSDLLLAPTFLFRVAVPCRYIEKPWPPSGKELPEHCAIPCFGELEDRPLFADLRLGWHASGLVLSLRVSGKKKSLWCRESRSGESDGLSLWIATREFQSIHRANRFCHRFVLLPQGGGPRSDRPVAQWLAIDRAREHPKDPAPGSIKIQCEKRIDGYLLRAHILAEAITGFDPEEHQRMGFSYAVIDRELGWQTFSIGPEFPFTFDPSLWGSLDLCQD